MTLLTAAAQAAPTVFFGENQAPGGSVSGAPATARAAFLATLVGVGSEGFETQALSASSPLRLSFAGSAGSITATLTGSGSIGDATTAGLVGRFNTTPAGAQFWNVSGSFEIDFSAPISAFGFFGTDIGDFDGQVTIELTDALNNVTNLTVANTVNGADGSLLFWGFVDQTVAYTKIRFGNTNAGTDVFGFDDMVVGDRQQVVTTVPEPTSLALVGLSLLGVAGIRRR